MGSKIKLGVCVCGSLEWESRVGVSGGWIQWEIVCMPGSFDLGAW